VLHYLKKIILHIDKHRAKDPMSAAGEAISSSLVISQKRLIILGAIIAIQREKN